MADAAVSAERLTKRFGGVTALDDVSLEVPAGGVLGLLGPNGAGKTTAVRILATLLRPDSGQARVAGLDLATQAARVRRLIGLSGQYAAVDPFLTGRENLVMIGRLHGLDPEGRLALWQLLGELTARGTSLLLTTQYLEEAERLATSIVVLGHGRVIAAGTPSQLKARSGGDRLEVTVPPGDDPAPVARALAGLGTGPPEVDSVTGRVVMPVAGGPAIFPELAARLTASSVRVGDVALRRPTLEEAFLALTSRPGLSSPGRGGDHPASDPGSAPEAVR
jgi:ABC-type multidrug transport system ATPase subunit